MLRCFAAARDLYDGTTEDYAGCRGCPTCNIRSAVHVAGQGTAFQSKYLIQAEAAKFEGSTATAVRQVSRS